MPSALSGGTAKTTLGWSVSLLVFTGATRGERLESGLILQVSGKRDKVTHWEALADDVADYIPSDLGQQTQTLMRMTMESPLTAKVGTVIL